MDGKMIRMQKESIKNSINQKHGIYETWQSYKG